MQASQSRGTSCLEAFMSGIRNMFGSGLLAIAGLILVIASVLSFISCLLPFWFKLTLYNQRFGDEVTPNNITIDCGLFFMDKDKMINVLMVDKATSVRLMPVFLNWAQFFFLVGTIGIFVCTGTAVMLMMRDKVIVSAEMALTGGTTAIALCEVLSIILCFLQKQYDNRAMWQDLPVKDAIPDRYNYYKVLQAYPLLEFNWAYYFALISAIFCLAAAFVLWIQMITSCLHLTKQRYQMLREKPDFGSSPIPGYPYYANKGYMQHPAGFPGYSPEARPLIYTDRPLAGSEVDL